jgi:uncharacterized membrane protein
VATLASLLVGLHVIGGFLALTSLPVPLLSKKGSTLHVRAGRLYVWAMVAASTSAIAIAPVRMLQRPAGEWRGPIFLAYLGLMALTSALFGVRVLRQRGRRGPHELRRDYVLPLLLAASSVALVIWALATGFVLAVVFAGIGLLLVALPLLSTLRRAPPGGAWWVAEHLGAMIVSCIGTITAFLVVNAHRVLDGPAPMAVWFAPSLVLVPMMIVWQRRYTQRPTRRALE